ncbi:hypothetical protein CCHL11_06917 [Colletotrichum chlorophyti]|uniref:Uncharacterized protein n=1 Tax=Colletotrichum chlorophyti TaxID=708187 RepID=A0A1Q8RBD7_9PEZI|nr:hypothetical protein CCHL11_06917 [Colletotrichum chlorophyti]
MPLARNLPNPAKGDIFAYDGQLKINNAAANVFIVYDRQPESSAHPPSSLSIHFVLGNVYLIDSTLAPFRQRNPQVCGTIVKGLGLQEDGRRRGNVIIETVYDDIVCVIANQDGATCQIKTVAGNLVTVSDMAKMEEVQEQPHNINVNYVHGLSLEEPHIAYGGGLKRASPDRKQRARRYRILAATSTKQNKQNMKKEDAKSSHFATGANCTILQRPLPPGPPVRDMPPVQIKQEPSY